MDNINERISSIIKSLSIKKCEFANRINVSQAFVSQLCSGASVPSDRTVSDICREFNVNEVWLRTGEGEMFLTLSRRDEIAAFLGDVLHGSDDSFQARFVSALARIPSKDWDVIQHFMEDAINGKED